MKKFEDSFSGTVSKVSIGKNNLSAGGEGCLPFYDVSGRKYEFLTAYEILDKIPENLPEYPADLLKGIGSPAEWALKCRDSFGAEAICLNLLSMKPDEGGTDTTSSLRCISEVLSLSNLPLILRGTGIAEIDNEILASAASEFKGENLVIASVTLENYREIAGAVLENGHSIVAESPVDINIAKQLNILLREMGFGDDRIISDPTTGALGYGLEYSCSIMERARLAGFSGDKALSCPFINFIGSESWRSREAESSGAIWEAATAQAFVLAGCSIAVMRSPEAVRLLNKSIDSLR